ncbi:MAG: single-stranded DNA-binding protein [Flavobacteriales bacterium]
MNNLRNKVQLIGRLGQTPELKTLASGSTVVNFSLATTEKYKNSKGELVENTEWHNLVAWGKTAEIIGKYVQKGNEIAIEGKLTNKSWEDKTGNKRITTEVLVNEVLLMGNKPTESVSQKEEDLPF